MHSAYRSLNTPSFSVLAFHSYTVALVKTFSVFSLPFTLLMTSAFSALSCSLHWPIFCALLCLPFLVNSPPPFSQPLLLPTALQPLFFFCIHHFFRSDCPFTLPLHFPLFFGLGVHLSVSTLFPFTITPQMFFSCYLLSFCFLFNTSDPDFPFIFTFPHLF